MISDQDRQIADETFGLIERSNPEPAPMTAPEPPADTTARDIKRRDMISGLRAMADALENHPELPIPYSIAADTFWRTGGDGRIAGQIQQDDARQAMAALPGGWAKTVGNTFISYVQPFGDDVSYSICVERSQVCQRIQVGTRPVPAHDEPIYEWKCEPDADVSMALAERSATSIPCVNTNHGPAVAVLVWPGSSPSGIYLCARCAGCSNPGCHDAGVVLDMEHNEPWCTRHAEGFPADETPHGPEIVLLTSQRFVEVSGLTLADYVASGDVSMALAEHTASAIDKILGA